ncbi:pantoate--beta-alanine ligase [Bosea sp. 117]|uniref:pantoate--beta-alanine ligase n=1 Tax=Bosea sp. 117 TaxID=1125973 RepID=UPI000494CA25|nr:pantoate--beta-alanine ligase [Bosea sp. 117]
MANDVKRIKTLRALRRQVAEWRAAGERIGLVPTMGALHAGHIALVRAARRRADRVIVSIFVNPTQFGPNEDFGRYPRTLAADLSKLAKIGTDATYLPAVEEVYPEGFCTTVSLAGPALDLEGAFRPTHFAGVATVVCKLFTQVAPDLAFFGEKDYQQLKVVTRMARDLDLPVRVVGVPTVRERDGLALSSRNVYLSPADRAAAPALNTALRQAAAAIESGGDIAAAVEEARAQAAQAGFALDYLEARHAETLAPIASLAEGPVRLLVAGRIGGTRLIDNIAVKR